MEQIAQGIPPDVQTTSFIHCSLSHLEIWQAEFTSVGFELGLQGARRNTTKYVIQCTNDSANSLPVLVRWLMIVTKAMILIFQSKREQNDN